MSRSRRVLDVGQCGPDHAAISRMLQAAFDVDIVRAHSADDAFRELQAARFDLVLINRKLDCDYSDGLLIIQRMANDEHLKAVPVMLVSNYPEYQEQAVAAGARYGFGKAELQDPAVHQRLAAVLGKDSSDD